MEIEILHNFIDNVYEKIKIAVKPNFFTEEELEKIKTKLTNEISSIEPGQGMKTLIPVQDLDINDGIYLFFGDTIKLRIIENSIARDIQVNRGAAETFVSLLYLAEAYYNKLGDMKTPEVQREIRKMQKLFDLS